MRRLVGPLIMSVALGCDGATPPTAYRGPPDSLLRTVETYAFAVNHRDYPLYVSVLTDDFESVNDQGECLDWLHAAYWAPERPDVCGTYFVGLELAVTNEHLLEGGAVEVTTSVVVQRASAEPTGATSDHIMVLTLIPTEDAYEIQRVHVRDPFVSGSRYR